ncbi:hypothetical protein NDI45_08070 [Leptolyngbya sp. GB1-A1]|uniref:hypothetical protein n=1 Tax=Leptolyngbya sp. GB1-A1 TaxID=2933908 RepID=UPI003299358C
MKKRREPCYEMRYETLYRDYKAGFISAAGYLYYYIKTQRRDGWKLRIKSVSQFCKKLRIGRSTFYKAKAALIAGGWLQEEIIGSLDLWVPTDKGVTVEDAPVPVSTNGRTLSTNGCTLSTIGNTQSTNGRTDTPQTQTEQASCNSTDLFSDPFSDLSLSPPPTPERELLDFVIRRLKGTELIRNERAYALKVIERDRAHWEEEYRKHQQRTAQTDLPPPVPPPEIFDERESLMGLIRHYQDQQKPVSAVVKQRAQELGIRLTGASTDGND